MSRRPAHELEALPHHVYVHTDNMGVPIYVGRTAHPDTRPWDTKRREWIKDETREVEVSPPMSFEAAAWMETTLIRGMNPKHNKRSGQLRPEKDWRVDRLCEVDGCTRSSARFALQYMPRERDAFEAFLVQRAENAAALAAAMAAPDAPRSGGRRTA